MRDHCPVALIGFADRTGKRWQGVPARSQATVPLVPGLAVVNREHIVIIGGEVVANCKIMPAEDYRSGLKSMPTHSKKYSTGQETASCLCLVRRGGLGLRRR